MSTRGAVAIKQDDGSWKGVYNRYDSYPTGLGKEVFNIIDMNGDLEKFAKNLLKYNTWKSYKQKDLDIGRETEPVTSDNPDPLWVEWVYVVDVENEKLEILTSKDVTSEIEGEPLDPDEKPKKVENGWDYGHCIFTHEKVAEYDLNKGEPDWEALEDKVYNDGINSEKETDKEVVKTKETLKVTYFEF